MTNAQPTTQATIQPASPSAAHPAAESLAESASQAPRTDRTVNLPGSPDERHRSAEVLQQIENKTLGATVGHVHLQVGHVPTARRFYVDTLGFQATNGTLPGVLFATAGGYHHHVAMNTWNSAGAGPRAAANPPRGAAWQ